MLLFLLRGLFLLRAADRNLFGSLFHEPPRSTRGPPFGSFPLKVYFRKDPFAQPQRFRVVSVTDPGLHAGVEIGPVQPALGVALRESAQPASEPQAIFVAQAPPFGKHAITQHIQPFLGLADLGLGGMQAEPYLRQPFCDPVAPHPTTVACRRPAAPCRPRSADRPGRAELP
jgi:hypothetical protein